MSDRHKRRYIEDAFDTYLHCADRAADNQFERALWFAWGSSAIVIEAGLEVLPGFEIVPDSLYKARCLVDLFIQPMVSAWYHNWESQEKHSDEEKETVRRIAFKNVQTFLSISSQESIGLHLGFDKEFRAILNKERESTAFYVGMFHQRYRECATGEEIVEWDKLEFPIQSFEDFLGHCDKSKYKYLGMESSVAVFSVIGAAGSHMFTEFNRMYKAK